MLTDLVAATGLLLLFALYQRFCAKKTAARSQAPMKLAATQPLPYRPFRWGPTYPQHMGIRNIAESSKWLQLDNEYADTIRLRATRMSDPSLVSSRTQPGYHAHALESLVEMASFLSLRFPKLFTVERTSYVRSDPSSHGDSTAGKEAGAIRVIHNHVTGEVWDLEVVERAEGPEWDPMRVAGHLVQDDLAVVVEDENGEYRFQAGSVCTAGFWRLQDKIGLALDEIHFGGAVPNYADKYQRSMNRFFSNLREDKLFERNNYFFQVDEQLAWSEKTNGTEAVFDHFNKGPRLDLVDKVDGVVHPAAATRAEDVWFRTERQTLRRLPKTRAILFTVRTYLVPVTKLADEPGVPGRMASAIRSWPQGDRSVTWYKGGELFNPVLLPFLDQKHKEQLAAGVLHLNDKGTTGERYPF
ncbi:hypothetical protein DMC30DRAFT_413325 [Rhodotorula diobovata]|uniref:Uncharacterized protein n=1 Tax=Rhodotorula diobovata TaxID=5288 RepID=A0A5C5G5N5_9BASI|nr:hypothetical protein DMC30DRAFT_413325 [Rhodotorula diobovata]